MNIHDLFTDDEQLLIQAHARHFNMSFNEYVKRAVLRELQTDGYSPEDGTVLGYTVIGKSIDLDQVVEPDNE